MPESSSAATARSFTPSSTDKVLEILRSCEQDQATIQVSGASSKHLMGGCTPEPACHLQTLALNRLLLYEPADLTISVEAGMRFSELDRILKEQNQVLPLDPPYFKDATIGGVLATNSSGPSRRRFGTARDMVIGMSFATIDGKLVSSGGMVVKNVTGLDMAKLMIGSYGTLAVITSVNFKVFSRPEDSTTCCFSAESYDDLLGIRRAILTSALQPNACDWLNKQAAAEVGLPGKHVLLLQASGSPAATHRFAVEFKNLAVKKQVDAELLDVGIWDKVREFTPAWLEQHTAGAVIQVSTLSSRLGELLYLTDHLSCPVLLRAGNGVGYVLTKDFDSTKLVLTLLRDSIFNCILEAAQDNVKKDLVQWVASGNDLDLMQRVKADFDPGQLLNRQRLYGVI